VLPRIKNILERKGGQKEEEVGEGSRKTESKKFVR
jgi:hypothetical protein